jgi:hypothetical protein
MVHDGESIVNLVQGSVELALSDNKRRSDVKNGGADPHEDSILE